MLDFILNGQANGSVAQTLMAHGCSLDALRPWLGDDGRSYMTVVSNENGKMVAKTVPTMNAATLRKDEWKEMDDAIIRVARPRMRLFGDLRAAGLTYNIPNAMGKMILENETQGDIGDADVSMDGLRRTPNERPTYELQGLPLPIIHKDFSFPLRQILASRNGSTPLDTTNAEQCGIKVAEAVEKLTSGELVTRPYGGYYIYGYTTFPNRITKALTDPAGMGWTPATLVQETLAMKALSVAAYHRGPWKVYAASAWDEYLDDDYSASKGDLTLRERLKKIEGITDVVTADFMSDLDFVMVQQSSNVARAVVGADIQTVQWESHGGMQLNYKVMCILVPQIRADQNGNTGIVHGSVA